MSFPEGEFKPNICPFCRGGLHGACTGEDLYDLDEFTYMTVECECRADAHGGSNES